MLNGVPAAVGAGIEGYRDLFWPSKADTGYKVGSIALNAVNDKAPGFVKEFVDGLGLVWRRTSAEEIQKRRTTTLWK